MRRCLSAFLCATLLVVALSSCAFSSFYKDAFAKLSENGELQEVGVLLPENDGCEYVSDYLAYWGFPSFRLYKVKAIEDCYRSYYYRELPNLYQHAAMVYDAYREYAAGYVDKTNPDDVTGMVISLYQRAAGDKYAVYMDKAETASYKTQMQASLVGIGVSVQYHADKNQCIVVSTVPDSPAEKAGIKVGDRILSADGVSLDVDGYEAVVRAIGGKAGTRVSLVISRDDKAIEYAITREEITLISVTHRMIEQDVRVGYIKINEFNNKTAEQFRLAIDSVLAADARGIVFDVRDNPGGDVTAVSDVLDYLIKDGGPLVHFCYREGSELADQNTTLTADDGHAVSLPMTVLCNENTASAAELFTSALRDYQMALAVGETTYGKGTAQSVIELADDTMFTISVSTYNPPFGDCYEGVGIVPDVEVSLSDHLESIPPSLRDDRDDAQLQAAIGLLKNGASLGGGKELL